MIKLGVSKVIPFDINNFIEFVETDGTAFNGKFTLENYKDFIEMQIDKKFKINTINKRIKYGH